MNTMKKKRIVYLPEFKYINSKVTFIRVNQLSQEIKLSNGYVYFITNENKYLEEESFYHFPLLLNDDLSLWYEAANFILKLAIDDKFNYSSQKIARVASRLLDYKVWCEHNTVDMFDFSALRAKNRPTYRYFKYLCELGLSAGNVNQRTSLIYKFTTNYHIKYGIELKRIDQVSDAFVKFKNTIGHQFVKKVQIRKLTKKIAKRTTLNTNAVIDDGEVLRPLNEEEQKELINALNNPRYRVDEKLIFQLAIDTGARKQTILTLRLKHVKQFIRDNLSTDGYYKISAGFSTDIDTKFDKQLVVSIPKSLGERLKIYAFSPVAVKRRRKFIENFGGTFKNEDDIYLFLGERGDCRYMAKNDPRYEKTQNPPLGTSIQTIINRLFKYDLPASFPCDYRFHWNRASYAFNYYQFLKPLVDNKKISYQDQIACIQNALGHNDPRTTEDYLKIFTGNKELSVMQSKWEDKFLKFSTFDKYSKELN